MSSKTKQLTAFEELVRDLRKLPQTAHYSLSDIVAYIDYNICMGTEAMYYAKTLDEWRGFADVWFNAVITEFSYRWHQ